MMFIGIKSFVQDGEDVFQADLEVVIFLDVMLPFHCHPQRAMCFGLVVDGCSQMTYKYVKSRGPNTEP